jgi:superfamily II DNA or RNA helicase
LGIDLSKYSGAFDSHIKTRGAGYFRQRRVKIVSMVLRHEAYLKIKGSQTYDVRLRFDGFNQLMMTCTCQNYKSGYNCKHIWASILEVDRHYFFDQPAAPLVDLPQIRQAQGSLNGGTNKNQAHGQAYGLTQGLTQGLDQNGAQGLVQGEGPGLDPSLAARPAWMVQLRNSSKRVEPDFRKAPYASEFSLAEPLPRVGIYGLDLDLTRAHKKWALRIFSRPRRKSGELGSLRSFTLNSEHIQFFESEQDRRILWTLLGISTATGPSPYENQFQKKNYVFLDSQMMEMLVAELSSAGQMYLVTSEMQLKPISYDPMPLQIQLSLTEQAENYILSAKLSHQTFSGPIESQFIYHEPYLLMGNRLIRANFGDFSVWFETFQNQPQIAIPPAELDRFLEFYFNSEATPDLTLPESLQIKNQYEFQKVRLSLESAPSMRSIQVRVQFLYGQEYIDQSRPRAKIFQVSTRTMFHRDFEAELKEAKKLRKEPLSTGASEHTLGAYEHNLGITDPNQFLVNEEDMESLIEKAFGLGWEVIAFQRKISPSQSFKGNVSSGIDWFDLSVKFEFGKGLSFGLPQLLQNLKAGQRFITLADGSYGLIREEWIKKFGRMAQLGVVEGDHIRLTKVQALFFASELVDGKKFTSDKKFQAFQSIIEEINNLEATTPGAAFKGKLRSYQKAGLSWINLMSKHEMGAILADDMGLGKTIQILASLASQPKAKTLIVAPKSLVHNWISEAEKFTPHLNFYNHTGPDRMSRLSAIGGDVDVFVTTYHTLRLDIEFLKAKEFDYFILDEAHYIKNSESQAYMACRMIQSRMKIALTGTPVENSLTDLFSILSIVTPGLISDNLAGKYAKENNPESLRVLSKSLRPFILRRTKDQVLKDLPSKTEQVLYCELSPSERKKYTELKNHYWNKLNGKIEQNGFAKSKFDILEALLRLRQASCHPGLLNRELAPESSSKFDLLLEQLDNVLADGHKALIFSQFTSLLGLLEPLLKAKNIEFEYLDGRTNDRSTRVKNFQENPDIKVFLISLKAGGVGLNLTSADYVFILDPWWNPAAESQAIDRAHRIGQTKKVFAYKIIAKDTVEEKILALQEHKRVLASAIISSEKSLLKDLKVEDLRELFS